MDGPLSTVAEDRVTQRRAVGIGAVAAVGIVGIGVAFTATRGPDDNLLSLSEARRMLVSAADARRVVEVGDDSPTRGFRTVVFFLRDGQYPAFVRALRDWGPLTDSQTAKPTDIVAVLPHEPQGPSVITPVGGDPTGRIARAYGMPMPPDGGPPVGYAIVDTRLRLRYATADPDVLAHLDQVAAVLEAAP